jgi:ubiquinone/menaquinone biosynthesis C-methylase UbiE
MINRFFEKGLSRFFPGLYSFLINRGFYVESRWKKMASLEYLKDDHPDRSYFVNFVREGKVQSILEIGAGSQFEARRLREIGQLTKIAYTIMDVNKFWLKEGKKHLPEVDFRYGSINKIPFPENSFDIVYCRHVIEHQPYYEIPLKEMMRVSRDWVFLNIFRWSLQEDIIRRQKYYSNAYSITKLLDYCRGVSKDILPFIVLKQGRETLGENIKKDEIPFVRRTGDHMVILIRKDKEIQRDTIKNIAELTKANILFDLPDVSSSSLSKK